MEKRRMSLSKFILMIVLGIFFAYQVGYAIGKFVANYQNSISQ
ncbi:hypothetical protein [Capnocytophaga stomatis]|uniref:Uncharacterized protein n=1 Tax=Capnocytophaga stomatis TaxID=1848904 RepID=A0ABW8QCQ1_9FLAO|nr:hypothetical protein [Capnocytophaga stomatis]